MRLSFFVYMYRNIDESMHSDLESSLRQDIMHYNLATLQHFALVIDASGRGLSRTVTIT